MTIKKWIGEDEFCSKIIKGASVAVLAAAALAVVIGLLAVMTSFDRERKRREMGVCPAEITVLQGDGTHLIRYYAELPCDKLDALARESRRTGK